MVGGKDGPSVSHRVSAIEGLLNPAPMTLINEHQQTREDLHLSDIRNVEYRGYLVA